MRGRGRTTRGPACRVLLLVSLCLPIACSGKADSAPEAGAATAPAPRPVTSRQVLEHVRSSTARVVLVNVWATWCVPCRQEFPDLMRLRREYRERGLDLVLVSADFDTPLGDIVGFLGSQGVDFPTYLKDENDMDFIEAMDPGWSGALPASFLYDGEGTLRKSWEGMTSPDEIEAAVRDLLGAPREAARKDVKR